MSDVAVVVEQETRGVDTERRESRVTTVITGCVIAVCLIACLLILLLPADSLRVDLVYQGF